MGLIQSSDPVCKNCGALEDILKKSVETQPKSIHPNTPISTLSRDALEKELKMKRASLRQMNLKVERMEKEIKMGISVSGSVSNGLCSILDTSALGNHPNKLLALFWEQQKKALNSKPTGMRWHPMMIRLAIFLHYQSPRAYQALKDTGVLKLPNQSTLRDYTNYFQTKGGFQPHVFQELKELSHQLESNKRFVCLLHDEMSVRSDLVYDRRSGELVGFTAPDTWRFNEDDMTDNIATHVLVFMIVGVNNHLKMSIAHFPTRNATADQLYPLLWKAISYLELACGLKVISSTSDKASPNQRLYRMHKMEGEAFAYRAVNVYADEPRYIYFFSDVPHLLKTLRNNLNKSQAGGTKFLWNQGEHILWSHVYRVYQDDTQNDLYRTKLRYDHVHLTPSSKMSVRLATQVFSASVARVMQTYYMPDMRATAEFLLLFDRFFDCLNVRSHEEAIARRKPDLAPYRSLDDVRFTFLCEEVLGYLAQWQSSVQNRDGFSKTEKNKMMLSYQTVEGIRMTVLAFSEATRYLLSYGVPYVFSQVFSQDPLEEHFGRHRGLAGRADNPTMLQYGYQENQLRIQRNLAFMFQPRGNTAGRNGQDRPEADISDSPVKKRRY